MIYTYQPLMKPRKIEKAYKVCSDCGNKYGRYRAMISSFWNDKCDVCGKETSVTEARDYNYLKK